MEFGLHRQHYEEEVRVPNNLLCVTEKAELLRSVIASPRDVVIKHRSFNEVNLLFLSSKYLNVVNTK
jgi:hypothetical protein